MKHAQNIAHSSQKPLLYRIKDAEHGEYTKNSLLLPVFCEGRGQLMRGILECSNTDHEIFTFDEEYFGILVAQFLQPILQRLIDGQAWRLTLKYRASLLDGYS